MEGMSKAEVDRLEAKALGPGPLRPRDAGTLILIDRHGRDFHVLMGRRHLRHAFMPGKFVFPGGRTDPSDSRIGVASHLHPQEEAKLTAGVGRTSIARARAIALSFHPRRPLAYVSLDDDRVGVFDLERARFDHFIATQREPDVSKVVLL